MAAQVAGTTTNNGGGGEERPPVFKRGRKVMMRATGNHGGKPAHLLSLHEVSTRAGMAWSTVRQLLNKGVIEAALVDPVRREGAKKAARIYFRREVVQQLRAYRKAPVPAFTHTQVEDGGMLSGVASTSGRRRRRAATRSTVEMVLALGRIEGLLSELLKVWRG